MRCRGNEPAQVVEETRVYDIRDINTESEEEIHAVDTVEQLSSKDIVIDIRSPEEEEENPLEIDNVEVIHIPFYKLTNKFSDLAQDKEYLLYCDQGVMSKLQALYLIGEGYKNVKVYRP